MNLLKPWIEPKPVLTPTASSKTLAEMNIDDLSPSQQQDLLELEEQFWGVFPETLVVQHDEDTPGTIVRQQPYWVSEAHCLATEEEVDYMFQDSITVI